MSKGRGWHGQSYRHSLAARGIKTVGLSRVEDIDDLSDFLTHERIDICRDHISTVKVGVERDKRNLERMKDLDARILDAMDNNEMDLAEILIDAKHGDDSFNLRASGVLQKIREKVSGSSSDLPLEKRKVNYSVWYEREVDKRNRKISSAPTNEDVTRINDEFDTKSLNKRKEFGLDDATAARIELDAHKAMTVYPTTERAKIQRERDALHPTKMVPTGALLVQDDIVPQRIAEKFAENDIATYYHPPPPAVQVAEEQRIDANKEQRDLAINAIPSESLAVQKDLSRSLAKIKRAARKEYDQELKKNRSLRVQIGSAMQEEWDIIDDEIALREQTIAEAEKALAAGGRLRSRGIVIPSSLLAPIAQGIAMAAMGSSAVSPQPNLTPQTTPVATPQANGVKQ